MKCLGLKIACVGVAGVLVSCAAADQERDDSGAGARGSISLSDEATQGSSASTTQSSLNSAQLSDEKSISALFQPSESNDRDVAVAGLPLNENTVKRFDWNSNMGRKQLRAHDSNVCVLSKVTGPFNGGGEKARIYWDSSGWWWLDGQTGTSPVYASAYCFAHSLFSGLTPTSIWTSAEGWLTAGFPYVYNKVDMWQNDAVTFLSGISGNFNGYGEWAAVWQGTDPYEYAEVRVRTEQSFIQAFGHSFFVGVPQSGRPAQFDGPGGIGDIGVAGDYRVDGSGTVFMAPTESAMCGITFIAGRFRGTGESVEIYPATDAENIERWVLRTASQQGGMQARSRCYTFNQGG